MERLAVVLGSVAVVASLAACSTSTGGEGSARISTSVPPAGSAPSPSTKVLELPPPSSDGTLSLEQTLLERRSIRSFTREDLKLEELSQLLWAAQGVTVDWGGRTAPSAGALYPLEVYAATADGLLHYLPAGHRAGRVSARDVRPALAEAALGQTAVAEAPVIVAITAVTARTVAKYGERGRRYVLLEAGHVAQNVLLQAVALGLGAVPIGAFSDHAVAQVLGLRPGWEPLYLIPIGHPAE